MSINAASVAVAVTSPTQTYPSGASARVMIWLSAAMTVQRALATAGNALAAVQMQGLDILDWVGQGALANLNDVAAAEGWDAGVRDAPKAFAKVDGKSVSAPVYVHSTN